MQSLFQHIKPVSLAELGFTRLLFEEADFSGDPVTGTKFISLSETAGDEGETTVTLKRGINAVNERQPDHQPYWGWDITDEMVWNDNKNVELIIEFPTPTTSTTDVMCWLGLTNVNTPASFTTKGLFHGFRHSPVFSTDPFAGRFQNNTLTYNTAQPSTQHGICWMNSPKGQIAYSNNIGIRQADWSGFLGDILSRVVMSPNNVSDPVRIVFTAGTMQNVALGSAPNKSYTFRIWYRVTTPEPN